VVDLLNKAEEAEILKMMLTKAEKVALYFLTTALLCELLLRPGIATAQEEAASAIRRYKEREFSTGYYEEFEVRPVRQRPLVGVSEVKESIFRYSPTAAQVRIRTRLADSHMGIGFYQNLRCDYCHIKETKDVHTVVANLTCRQCHGGEPIASIEHFYSPLNPIRRHAYVCSKCHEGASASFASYVVHEPPAGAATTRNSFPVLFYAYWLMVCLLGGTLAFFVPHSLMVGWRELFKKRGKDRK